MVNHRPPRTLAALSRALPDGVPPRAHKPPTPLRMHSGPLASGASVLATSEPIDEIRHHGRKLIGVEMEAYAVHLACHAAVDPPPAFVCMKSVCDFADEKNDDWQPYAAFTAAEAFRAFLRDEWEALSL